MTAIVRDWPLEGLDHLDACPCCGAPDRSVAFEELRDLAFHSAPGAWTMWRCETCRCSYLDPRPSPETIGVAYENYYTHGGAAEPCEAASPLRRAASWALYRAFDPAASTNGLPAKAERWLDAFRWRIRHLPRPGRRGERLLDVGCGDGAFLLHARKRGYEAVGLDFDPAALAQARDRGFDARQGSLPGSGLPEGGFHQITMSNVLEHLHDPVGALDEALRLLAPGGRLWLSQPNLGAEGLRRYGLAWRGLEAPRHLTLWDTEGLAALLERRGFADVALLEPEFAAHDFYYRQSHRQQRGLDPYSPQRPDGWDGSCDAAVSAAIAASRADPRVAESLTMVAFRPR